MKTKLFSIIGSLLFLALCFAFLSCPDPKKIYEDEPYDNPYAGQTGEVLFSRKSGVYETGFELALMTAIDEGKDIYYTLDGSIPVPGKTGTVKYSAPLNITNRNNPMAPNVLSATANHNRMFMNASDPTRDNNNTSPNTITDNHVPKATVVRAIAVDKNGKKSEPTTMTYFVGTNARLFGDTNVRIISLVAEYDDLVSNERGIMVTGGPDKVWGEWDTPMELQYNYRQRGAEWGRAAAFELFDTNKKPLLSTNVEIRIRGGWSRGNGQKSFNIYFRSNNDLNTLAPGANLTGINNFVRSAHGFELIPGAVKANGQPTDIVKSFMLRSGGNDSDQTKFYDVFIHDVLKNKNFTTQAAKPVIVYINGEYWGPYNMQERYSDNFIEYKYGIPRDLVISIDNGTLDDGNPGEDGEYWSIIDEMISSGNFNNDRFDIDNFAEYWAAQIYIHNEDWPQNNYIVWKTRSNSNAHPYGDTKWRYSLHDSEFSMGIYNGGSLTGQKGMNAFNKIFNGEYSYHRHNRLIKKLLGPDGDDDFKEKFINAMLELCNVDFHPDNVNSKIDQYAAIYRPLMGPDGQIPGYGSRWSNWRPFDNNVSNLKKYISDIRSALPGYLSTYIDGISSGDITSVVISSAGASVPPEINGISVSSGWSGVFYKTVNVKAGSPPAGYEFDGWAISGGTAVNVSALNTTVTLAGGSASITAKYKQAGVVVVNPTAITLSNPPANLKVGDSFTLTATFTPSNTTYKTVIWTSSNPNKFHVDNTGRVTVRGGGTATITATSTVNASIKGTKDITLITVFMSEPHAEGIKLIINKSMLVNKNQWIEFRPAGWGNGARLRIDTGDARFTDPNKIEVIYPFVIPGQSYSIDVDLDGNEHTITEIPAGGLGILSRTGTITYNGEKISYSAELNSISNHLKLKHEGWLAVYLKGTGWDNYSGWEQIPLPLMYGNNLKYDLYLEEFKEDIFFIYEQIVEGDVFALLYYEVIYDGLWFKTQEISTTFYFPEYEFIFNGSLPDEKFVSSHSPYEPVNVQVAPELFPEKKLVTSPSNFDIVHLPGMELGVAENDFRKMNIIKVVNPSDWAVVLIPLEDHEGNSFKDENIFIGFDVRIRREGSPGVLNWQINNSDHPTVVYNDDPDNNGQWIWMSVEFEVTPTDDNPFLYLTTSNSNSENTTYYIIIFNLRMWRN